jgi:hypothetical protein
MYVTLKVVVVTGNFLPLPQLVRACRTIHWAIVQLTYARESFVRQSPRVSYVTMSDHSCVRTRDVFSVKASSAALTLQKVQDISVYRMERNT